MELQKPQKLCKKVTMKQLEKRMIKKHLKKNIYFQKIYY